MRIGVVGAGGLGLHHVRILRDLQGPDFAGFYESRADRAQQVASELGVRAFPTLAALLDEVDAVTIVVPTPGHYAVAQQVLARGIHAMIEKPLAATLEEADAMLALAREHGVVLQTGHVERFNRAIRAALPHVDAPRFIESDRLSPFNPRGSDVAVVLDLMIHDIDLVHTLVGGHATSVLAAGVPVVISPQCNMPEVTARGAGCVVEADRRAISAALKSLVKKDDAELKLMSEKARELAAELYDWARLVPRYLDMYRRATGRGA